MQSRTAMLSLIGALPAMLLTSVRGRSFSFASKTMHENTFFCHEKQKTSTGNLADASGTSLICIFIIDQFLEKMQALTSTSENLSKSAPNQKEIRNFLQKKIYLKNPHENGLFLHL
jgi:hypothetical protein